MGRFHLDLVQKNKDFSFEPLKENILKIFSNVFLDIEKKYVQNTNTKREFKSWFI